MPVKVKVFFEETPSLCGIKVIPQAAEERTKTTPMKTMQKFKKVIDFLKRRKCCRKNKAAPQRSVAEDTVDSSTVDQADSSFNQNTVHISLQAHPQPGPQSSLQTCPQSGSQACPQSGSQACPQSGSQACPQSGSQACPQSGSQPGPPDRASLHELLGVSWSECSRGSAQVSDETLIQEFVRSQLPEPPKKLDADLQRHLLDVQRKMQSELIRLAPWFDHKLMRVLTQSYHCAVFKQMKELLLQTSSSNTSPYRTCSFNTTSSRTNPSWTCLQLIHWALTQYLSQGLFLHPDLQTLNLLQYLDLVLLSDWTQDAQDKLLWLLQKDASSQLNKILERERQHQPCHDEEDYVSAYVDVIQCIDALPKEASKFSPELSLKLTRVCFKELLLFVQSYKTQWLLWLEMLKKKKMADREMLQFFRTLKICKELKKYISETRLKWTEVSDITEEIETLLEETEASTLTVLLDTVTVFTESGLKEYFKSKRQKNCFLRTNLEGLFRPESWLRLEEHKSTMDRCYRLIVSLYSKHLMSRRLCKLEKSWSPDVANSVSEDVELIHKIMTNLCPEVEECNFILHFISDLLNATDEEIKITAGVMLRKCEEKGLTEDASLLPALLRWKGLSKNKIKEVMDVPAPRSVLYRIVHWIQTVFSERNII